MSTQATALSQSPAAAGPFGVLAAHWRLYAIEGSLLALFMVSACTFAMLLEHPDSLVRQAIASPLLRRAAMGVAMGLTAILMIHSHWGRRSGAHMNPAVTLSFVRLNRIAAWDATFYIGAQFVGGAVGIHLIGVLLPMPLNDPSVNYVTTMPGSDGAAAAWIAEFIISFALMSTILLLNRNPRLAPFSGHAAALWLLIDITFEAPYSGMSMNPARSLASALPTGAYANLWIYFTAPVLGMLGAVEAHRWMTRRSAGKPCCKLSHCEKIPCHFRCDCLHPGGSQQTPANPPSQGPHP